MMTMMTVFAVINTTSLVIIAALAGGRAIYDWRKSRADDPFTSEINRPKPARAAPGRAQCTARCGGYSDGRDAPGPRESSDPH